MYIIEGVIVNTDGYWPSERQSTPPLEFGGQEEIHTPKLSAISYESKEDFEEDIEEIRKMRDAIEKNEVSQINKFRNLKRKLTFKRQNSWHWPVRVCGYGIGTVHSLMTFN